MLIQNQNSQESRAIEDAVPATRRLSLSDAEKHRVLRFLLNLRPSARLVELFEIPTSYKEVWFDHLRENMFLLELLNPVVAATIRPQLTVQECSDEWARLWREEERLLQEEEEEEEEEEEPFP